MLTQQNYGKNIKRYRTIFCYVKKKKRVRVENITTTRTRNSYYVKE